MLNFLLRPWVASCRETGERLSDYIDGELDGRTLARVRRHLSRCEHCQALLGSLARTLEQLRTLGSVEYADPAPATVDSIVARIRGER